MTRCGWHQPTCSITVFTCTQERRRGFIRCVQKKSRYWRHTQKLWEQWKRKKRAEPVIRSQQFSPFIPMGLSLLLPATDYFIRKREYRSNMYVMVGFSTADTLVPYHSPGSKVVLHTWLGLIMPLDNDRQLVTLPNQVSMCCTIEEILLVINMGI